MKKVFTMFNILGHLGHKPHHIAIQRDNSSIELYNKYRSSHSLSAEGPVEHTSVVVAVGNIRLGEDLADSNRLVEGLVEGLVGSNHPVVDLVGSSSSVVIVLFFVFCFFLVYLTFYNFSATRLFFYTIIQCFFRELSFLILGGGCISDLFEIYMN